MIKTDKPKDYGPIHVFGLGMHEMGHTFGAPDIDPHHAEPCAMEYREDAINRLKNGETTFFCDTCTKAIEAYLYSYH